MIGAVYLYTRLRDLQSAVINSRQATSGSSAARGVRAAAAAHSMS
jgi:hypothetical protein